MFKAQSAFMLNLLTFKLADPASILPEIPENCITHFYWDMWLLFEKESLSPSQLSLRSLKYFSIKHLKTFQDYGYGVPIKVGCLDLVEYYENQSKTKGYLPHLPKHIYWSTPWCDGWEPALQGMCVYGCSNLVRWKSGSHIIGKLSK